MVKNSQMPPLTFFSFEMGLLDPYLYLCLPDGILLFFVGLNHRSVPTEEVSLAPSGQLGIANPSRVPAWNVLRVLTAFYGELSENFLTSEQPSSNWTSVGGRIVGLEHTATCSLARTPPSTRTGFPPIAVTLPTIRSIDLNRPDVRSHRFHFV